VSAALEDSAFHNDSHLINSFLRAFQPAIRFIEKESAHRFQHPASEKRFENPVLKIVLRI
jgi:hypothetical protein